MRIQTIQYLCALCWCLWGHNTIAAVLQIPIAKKQQILQADFNQPSAVVTDKQGQAYILDGMNSRVLVFSKQGKLRHEINTRNTAHDFSKAMALAIDQKQLYIANTAQHRISVFSLTGNWLRDIALSAPLQSGKKRNELPEPVALLLVDKELIYADRRWHRVCYLALPSGQQRLCIGERGEMNGQFQYPFQMASDRDGYINVVDVLNARVQVLDRDGRYYAQTGRFALDKMYRPNGNAFDLLDFQYITDSYLGTISLYRQGRFLGLLKDAEGQIVKFSTPVSLHYNAQGYLYVVDARLQHVSKIELDYQNLARWPSQATEISRKNCVMCHYSWGNVQHDADLKNREGILPVAALDMCYSCHHGAVMDSRQAIPFGEQHPTVYDTLDEKKSRHKNLPRQDDIPDVYPHDVNNELSCTSCHTPHNTTESITTLYQENHNAWLRGTDFGSKQCEACHEKNTKFSGREDAKKYGLNHPLGVQMRKPEDDTQHLTTKDPHLQKGLPDLLQQGGGTLGKNNAIVCQSCHQVHNGITENLLTVTDAQGKLCASCHQRQAPKNKKAARKAGVHPVNVDLEEPVEFRGEKVKTVQCASCHSVHKGTPGTALFPDKIANAETLCINCHKRQHAKDEKEAAKKGIHPMNIKLDKAVKIAGSDVQKIGCLSCHAVHSGKPNTPALRENHFNGKLCENCHAGKQRIVGTDHDLRVTADDIQNQQEETAHQGGVCSACHTLHRGNAQRPFLSSVVLAEKQVRDKTAPGLKRDELCLNCHQKDGIAKDKPIAFYGHPYQDVILRSDEKILPLVDRDHEKKAELGVIACITCHEPHTWKPLKKPQAQYSILNYRKQENIEGDITSSFLRHKGVENTFCVDCHDIEALPKYKYFHHKDKVRNIGVDYLK